jgi:hypothetical protein
MSDIETDIEEFDDDDVPEGYKEILMEVKIATESINKILQEYNVNVVMSSLTSAIVQAICLTSSDLKEAQTTAANLSIFLSHAIDNADDQGICSWNQTRQ